MSKFNIDLSELAKNQINTLVNDPSKRSIAKAVLKSLEHMNTNLRHPSLNTHKYDDMFKA